MLPRAVVVCEYLVHRAPELPPYVSYCTRSVTGSGDNATLACSCICSRIVTLLNSAMLTLIQYWTTVGVILKPSVNAGMKTVEEFKIIHFKNKSIGVLNYRVKQPQ